MVIKVSESQDFKERVVFPDGCLLVLSSSRGGRGAGWGWFIYRLQRLRAQPPMDVLPSLSRRASISSVSPEEGVCISLSNQ